MENKRIYIDKTNEAEQNKEKNKKILVVLITLILFSGVYYYYTYFKKAPSEKELVSNQNAQKLMQNDLKKPVKAIEKKEPSKKTDNKSGEKNTKKEIKISTGKIILPTQKENIISFAVSVGGKKDPFYSENLKKEKVKQNSVASYSQSGLPYISGIPSNLPFMANLWGPVDPVDRIKLKGFIGNKAILSYDDDTQTLVQNSSFYGTKVISVNPYSMSVKLKKGGKIYTKNIKDLTEPSFTENTFALPKINL